MNTKQWLVLLRKKILQIITLIPEITRETIIERADTTFNYLQNSSLLSIPLSITLFWNDWTIKKYLLIVLSLWVLLPFIEHYYWWFREGWKEKD